MDFQKKLLIFFGAAVNLISRNPFIATGKRVKMSRMEILDLMDQWHPYAKNFISIIPVGTIGNLRRRLLCSPCFAMGMLTFKHQPERARQFWYETATGDIKNNSSPTRLLREYLLSIVLANNTNIPTGKMVANIDVIYAITLSWNAFCANKTLTKYSPKGLNKEYHFDYIPIEEYSKKD